MESFATPYSVIFNDGDNELDKGVVGIHSCLTFKRFQSMVGQKTGLPSAQLATVFVCKRTVGGTEKKQKIPINENTNFAIIISQHNSSKERDCFFMVSMKRSKKERKAPKKKVEADAQVEDTSARKEEVGGVVSGEESLSVSTCDSEDKSANLEGERDENKDPEESKSAIMRPGPLEVSNAAKSSSDQPISPSCSLPVPQQSAWKSGSILQRLSSGEMKSSGPDQVSSQPTAVSSTPRLPHVQCPVNAVMPGPQRHEKTGGTVSPTSVLDSSHLLPVPAIAHQAWAPGSPFLHPIVDKGSFSLFGQDQRAVDLRTLLEGAVAANLQFKAHKWCKFCAFCRERNIQVAPFHWCVDDQVVSGLRGPNPAGPIGARAMKHRVAAA